MYINVLEIELNIKLKAVEYRFLLLMKKER